MEKIKKVCNSIYLPFILLAIILIIFHIPIVKNADDVWFENILNNSSLTDYLISRYNGWTSRLVIETVLVTLCNAKVSLIIWKILNILMFELLVYSTYCLFIKDIKEKDKKVKLMWILFGGICILPTSILHEAGWIATTTNYLWPLTLRNVFNYFFKKELS